MTTPKQTATKHIVNTGLWDEILLSKQDLTNLLLELELTSKQHDKLYKFLKRNFVPQK